MKKLRLIYESFPWIVSGEKATRTVFSSTVDAPPAPFPPPNNVDKETILFILTAMAIGSIFSLVSLMGDKGKEITIRAVTTYLLSGGLASLTIILLFAEKYGFSWYLLALSICSGYKALDILIMAGFTVQALVRRITGASSNDGNAEEQK